MLNSFSECQNQNTVATMWFTKKRRKIEKPKNRDCNSEAFWKFRNIGTYDKFPDISNFFRNCTYSDETCYTGRDDLFFGQLMSGINLLTPKLIPWLTCILTAFGFRLFTSGPKLNIIKFCSKLHDYQSKIAQLSKVHHNITSARRRVQHLIDPWIKNYRLCKAGFPLILDTVLT